MELKLSEGRYVLDENHALQQIKDLEELKQRVALKLSVHRGSFMPLPDYGSRLYTLGRIRPAERETAARQFVLEALADEESLSLDTLELTEKNGDAFLNMTFSYGSETLIVETEI